MSEIEIRNLTKTFDIKGRKVHALKNISLSIEQGDIFGIIGMSGAGKSTLVRSINYLEKPTEGQVGVFITYKILDLADLTEKQLRKKRSEIGMIFQNFNLLEQKNVLDNICFPLEIAGVKKREARKRAAELLKTVNLEEKAKAYPSQLSGGQKQRISLARALLKEPSILVLDDTTSAVDMETESQIQDALARIEYETVFIIAHRISSIKDADVIIVLSDGEIAEMGNHDELIQKKGYYYTVFMHQYGEHDAA